MKVKYSDLIDIISMSKIIDGEFITEGIMSNIITPKGIKKTSTKNRTNYEFPYGKSTYNVNMACFGNKSSTLKVDFTANGKVSLTGDGAIDILSRVMGCIKKFMEEDLETDVDNLYFKAVSEEKGDKRRFKLYDYIIRKHAVKLTGSRFERISLETDKDRIIAKYKIEPPIKAKKDKSW